ncbi:hypothetical protein [Azospirillum argentinense]
MNYHLLGLAVSVSLVAMIPNAKADTLCIVDGANSMEVAGIINNKCKSGDSLIFVVEGRYPIPNNVTRIVPGMVCDLSKQVVVSDASFACVFSGKKELRE